MANRANSTRKHSAPGLYFDEKELQYASKSLGITTLGVSGETLKGPAFQPISVKNWREYQTYFGGTSTAKFKGSQYPRYELPYIAKSYLEQSQQLEVVRVLGLSGVNAGPAWVITGTKHKLYSGYTYNEINSVPEGVEWTDENTKDSKPYPTEVTADDPLYIRVWDNYKWHTLCGDDEGFEIETDEEGHVINVFRKDPEDGLYKNENGYVLPSNLNNLEIEISHLKQVLSYYYSLDGNETYDGARPNEDTSSIDFAFSGAQDITIPLSTFGTLFRYTSDTVSGYVNNLVNLGLISYDSENELITMNSTYSGENPIDFSSYDSSENSYALYGPLAKEFSLQEFLNNHTLTYDGQEYTVVSERPEEHTENTPERIAYLTNIYYVKVDAPEMEGPYEDNWRNAAVISYVTVDNEYKTNYIDNSENLITYIESGGNPYELVKVGMGQGSLSYSEYTYYKLVIDIAFESGKDNALYYVKESLYDYYKKVKMANIQLAEEDEENPYNNMVVAVIRSRGEHKRAAFVRHPTESDIENGICDDIYEYDGIEYYTENVRLEPTKSLKLGSSCNPGFSQTTGDFTVDTYNYGTFTVVVNTINGEEKRYNVSLNEGDKNYIYNVFGGNPEEGDAEIYIEELYDVALKQLIETGEINAINSEVVKYPAVFIVPKYKDVDDIIDEYQVLSKRQIGKRYLYSAEIADGRSFPIRYSMDNGASWFDGDGETGMIYTVISKTNEETGKKEFFYGAYASNIDFDYVEIEEEPKVEWIECTQDLTDEQQNAFVSDSDVPTDITSYSPEYIRVGDSEENYKYFQKEIVKIYPSTNHKKPTEQLTKFDFHTDIEENNGKFQNCVKVLSDDMFYILTDKGCGSGEERLDVLPVTLDFNNYRESYRYASTPWFVSEIKGDAENVELHKLFRFHTISDGNTSTTEFKVSIENIDPTTGKFDVVLRDYLDSDISINAIERFNGVDLVPGSADYIALKIGSFDEQYEQVSKYITVEVIENDVTKTSVPAGFLGYPVRNYSGLGLRREFKKYTNVPTPKDVDLDSIPVYDSVPLSQNITEEDPLYIKVDGKYYMKEDALSSEPVQPFFKYNTVVDEDLKAKKQYFGVSDLVGIDSDVFTYKGVEAYNNLPSGLTPCFHLDARIFNGTPDKDGYIYSDGLKQKVTVDEVTGYAWVTVNRNQTTDEGIEPRLGSDDIIAGTIYEDKKLRKFTAAFFGGWDGWDYYRTSRTIGDEYRYKEYKGAIDTNSGYGKMFSVVKSAESLGFEPGEKVITTDYYAYLGGVKQFANPKTIEINVLATPGIDYVNNNQLVNEVIDMVEEDRTDCVYITTTPDKPFGASDSEDDMYTPEEAAINREDSDIDSNHTATYYPWEKYYDSANSQYIYLPITRDVVTSIALTDNIAWPWYAAAGWNRGNLSGVRPKKKLKLSEQDTLYDAGINFVNSFANEGDKIWGDKNLQIKDTILNRLSKRRLLLRIKRLLQNACIGLLFDPNDPSMSKSVRNSVESVLDSVKANRGITDYRVEIDDSPETRDQLGLGVTYYIKASPLLEWIQFTSVLTPQGMEW